MKSIVVASYPDLSIFDFSKTGLKTMSYDSSEILFNKNGTANFLSSLKEKAGSYDIIFVPVTKNIINSLSEEGIKCVVLYPNEELKSDFIREMQLSKIDYEYIREIEDSWDYMIKSINKGNYYYKFKMGSNDKIVDSLKLLLTKRKTLGIDDEDFEELEIIA